MARWPTLLCALTMLAGSALVAQDALPPLRAGPVYLPRPPAYRPDCDPGIATSLVYDTVLLAKAATEPPRIVRVPDVVIPRGLIAVPARVLLQFVIDTAGRLAPCSVTVLNASDPRFVQAAVQTLEGIVFQPGRHRGRAVNTLAQQPIVWAGT